MKLRQKLAVALASAMVVTAVPVITTAASTNSLGKEVVIVATDSSAENTFNVKFNAPQEKEVFYLTISNAKWDSATMNTTQTVGNYTYAVTTQSSTVAKVVVTGATSSETVQIPLKATAVKGEAVVEVTPGDSTISKGSFVMATTEAKSNSLTATAGSKNSFYTNGTLADITVKENFKGSLTDGSKVTVELENSDFEFNFAGFEVVESTSTYTEYEVPASYVEKLYGFNNSTSTDLALTVRVYKADKATAVFTVALNGTVADSNGALVIQNIPVKATTKTPDTGVLTADVYAENASGSKIMTSTTLELATIADYGVSISMKNDKVVEAKAGTTQEIQFTIKENVEDTMVSGRDIELSLDNALFAYTEDENGEVTFDMEITEVNDGSDSVSKLAITDYEWVDEDDHSEGIKKIVVSVPSGFDLDDFTMKGDVVLPIANKDLEKVTVTAEGRALSSEAVSTQAMTIVNPFDVEVEPMTVKVGLKGQKAGKITLTETAAQMLSKGDITYTLKTKDAEGITFSGDATLEIEGDIKKAELTSKTADGTVTVKLPRQSKEASTISVSDIEVTVDRTVPEGSYDLVIGGSAIDENGYTLTIEDFLVVGTPNTEDLGSNGLVKGTSTFVIGESKYTVNGVEKTMDAASYVQEPGYTMVPVRYVAEAFGVAGNDILFSKGTVTMFAGNRTIQLTNGSDVAIVNGAQIKMATKVVIKEGRTYAPIGEVAQLLGINKAWDNTTKTATFTNK